MSGKHHIIPEHDNTDLRVNAAEAVELAGLKAVMLMDNMRRDMSYDSHDAMANRINQLETNITKRGRGE